MSNPPRPEASVHRAVPGCGARPWLRSAHPAHGDDEGESDQLPGARLYKQKREETSK